MKYGCRAKPPPVVDNIVNITSFAALQPSQVLRNLFTNWLFIQVASFDFCFMWYVGPTYTVLLRSHKKSKGLSLDTSNFSSGRPPATFRSIFAHLIEQEKRCFSWAFTLALGPSRQKQKEDHPVEDPCNIPTVHIRVYIYYIYISVAGDISLKFICDVSSLRKHLDTQVGSTIPQCIPNTFWLNVPGWACALPSRPSWIYP